MYVNNWIFHIIKNPANIETLLTEPPRIKYGKPSKFFPLFINICVHLLQSSVTPFTHKLFLSKDVLEKKFNPFSRPQAAISWLFPKISASIIDYPKILLLLHSAANHFSLLFKNSLISGWISLQSQNVSCCISAGLRCYRLQWLVTDGLRGD